MKYKFKPLMLGSAIAVSAALSGCGSDEAQPEITDVFAEVGLWCKSPDIVQVASADFYPLAAEEQAGLDAGKAAAKAAAEVAAGDSWDATAWEADFEYEDLDLYAILGLTIEEAERQAIAKEEARAFQISQGQDDIRGEGFDEWFDAWFAEIPPASYLGASQRINRSVNATTPEMDGTEICYTPPLSCPNYKVIDESGTHDCIVPELNLLDAPAPEVAPGANQAIAFYRHENHVDGGNNTALYENMVAHTWNDDAEVCTSLQADSESSWGLNSSYANEPGNVGIDPNYGMYWKLHLLDEPANCVNIIFNDTAEGKRISDTDLIMPIGPSGDVTLHNLDKMAYAHDDFPVNVFEGMLIINQHPYFGAEASSGIASCGWGMEPNDAGICVGEELVCPETAVAVGIGAEEIASKCVLAFDPDETALLLRGGFNGWGDDADPTFDASQLTYVGDGQYRVNYPYTTECEIVEAVEASEGVEAVEGEDCVTTYDFKVADINWSEPSAFGSIKGGDQSAVGTTITMTVGSGVGQNMKVDMAKDKIYQFLVNADDVAAVKLTINEVPVDAFPMLTLGEETMALSYTTNGQYVVRKALAAETHSFTIADSSTGFAVGAVGADNVVAENTPLALEDAGGALSFTSAAAEYDFILDMSDPANPTLEIKPALPWGSDPVYIRGSINGWGAPAADVMTWDGDSRSYSVIYGLEADGTHNFKFAHESWGPVNLGTGEVTFSDEGETLGGDGNIQVSVAKATSYKFEVSYATADPVVKVSEAPLYLRGGITGTGWGADDANQLGFMATDAGNTAEASHTYSLEVNYAGGEAQFKVADEGWGGNFGYNYGVEVADTAVELGVPLTLVNSNNNISIDIPAGTYIFSFEDGVTKTMTVTAKE